MKRKFSTLRRHCSALGRPYDAVLRSHYTPLLVLAETRAALERRMDTIRIPDRHLHTIPLMATIPEAIAHFQSLAEVGMQYFLAVINGHDTETVQLLADTVIPALSAAR